jgi:hypothetical protein
MHELLLLQSGSPVGKSMEANVLSEQGSQGEGDGGTVAEEDEEAIKPRRREKRLVKRRANT